ncbi:cbb3-type cytochrome oxidase assembly protein CcoS [Niabella hirudinis]|uniref:cbb3-type cytochrome oxidase assembly protein CcoS n=1 Tax=Niabella hirudinis TaxID=1285929 RepID=UPI003EBD9456
MSIIIITAIGSLFIALLFLAGLLWSIRDGQYEDEFSPPRRILFDEKKQKNK